MLLYVHLLHLLYLDVVYCICDGLLWVKQRFILVECRNRRTASDLGKLGCTTEGSLRRSKGRRPLDPCTLQLSKSVDAQL